SARCCAGGDIAARCPYQIQFMESFDLQHPTRIGAMNRSADADIREYIRQIDRNADVGIRAPIGRFMENCP
ncbi:MAG: hypothetical protein ABI651_07945, partial [Verrucomicrobiota bacterium]